MKLSSISHSNNFKPITITITIETPEEAQTLYQLGNYGTHIQDMMTEKKFAPKLPYDDVLTAIYNELGKYNLAGN